MTIEIIDVFSKNRQKSRFFGLFLPVFVKDGVGFKSLSRHFAIGSVAHGLSPCFVDVTFALKTEKAKSYLQ
jgi:hypothetical protein